MMTRFTKIANALGGALVYAAIAAAAFVVLMTMFVIDRSLAKTEDFEGVVVWASLALLILFAILIALCVYAADRMRK